MIRACTNSDFEEVRSVINDSASAYKGTIPSQLFREPWMSIEYLRDEIAAGVAFYGFEEDGELAGVMGVQDVQDVSLIRHSYVRTSKRRHGIGAALLRFHLGAAQKSVLVGCLKAMTWAIAFYEKHGFVLVSDQERDLLRAKYWKLSAEHVKHSVVLADSRWHESKTNF